MKVSSKCLSSTELRELLDGSLPDSGQTAVVAHLDKCQSCQHSLEALANPDSSFALTLLEQAAYKAPDATSAYWPALNGVESSLTVTRPHAATSSPDFSLAFLIPPADGSNLGSLANFNILSIVGRGGMGIVLHGVDTCLQRDVAIKILDPQLAKDEQARTRFCREARAAAKISHENVVAVHQVEEDEEKNIPFLVMELVGGESLEKKLLREGSLPLKEIVRIGMQTAAGLAAAHDKGLIHRDIKPGNILLEQSGRVKLTDFGLARAAEDVRLTRSGLVAGTPLYMSPEQAVGDELDARSDLFSLGVVLYELAAGETPFNAKTPLAVLKRVTDEAPVPLRERNPQIPEWFANIVERLLAKKPADRFQSAREVADTLEHFWAKLRSTETLACPKKKAAHVSTSIAIGVAAGVLTLLLGAGLLYFVLPPRENPENVIPPPLHTFHGSGGPLWSMGVSHDGKHLAMGHNDGHVRYWDIAGEKVLWTLRAHPTPVWTLALSPDGNTLATGSDDRRAVLWDLATQKQKHVLTHSAPVRAVAFDAEGKRLVTGSRDGAVEVWDVATGKKLFETAEKHADMAVDVAFSPDGKSIASAGNDKSIRIWDATTGGPKLTLSRHESAVYSVAFAPNSRHLVSGSWDKSVRLWDLDSGNQVANLDGHTQDVWSVAFHPQGKLFASGAEDQMVRIWSMSSQKQVAAFRGSPAAILNVRFSPAGDFLVAGGKDGTARLWRLESLKFASEQP